MSPSDAARGSRVLRLSGLACATCLCVWLGAADGVAQPAATRTARLEWSVDDVASACRDSSSVREQVQEILGRPGFVATDETDLWVGVRLGREPGGGPWTARIVIGGADDEILGERTITKAGAGCESLEVSLAVILALIIDLPRGAREEPAQEGPALQMPDDPPAEARDDGWVFHATAGAVGLWELVPGPALGIGAGVAFDPPGFWTIRAGLTILVTKEHEVEGALTAFDGYWGGLALSPTLWEGPSVGIESFAGASVGVLRGAGLNLTSSHTVSELHVQLDLGFTLRFYFGKVFEVLLDVGAALPLVRHTYTVTIDGQTFEAHRPWPVVPMVRVAVGAAFGR